MNKPTDEITVTMTREELEEISATQLKEFMQMLNETRRTLKEHPNNAFRQLAFVSRELERLNNSYIKALCNSLELEAV